MLQNNKVKQHKQTLSERYNKDFLKQAELRREKLQYKRMHVGQINNDRLEHMQNFFFNVIKITISHILKQAALYPEVC